MSLVDSDGIRPRTPWACRSSMTMPTAVSDVNPDGGERNNLVLNGNVITNDVQGRMARRAAAQPERDLRRPGAQCQRHCTSSTPQPGTTVTSRR